MSPERPYAAMRRRAMALRAVAAALACLPLTVAALDLRVDVDGLSPQQSAASERITGEVMQALPSEWQRALGRVDVRWSDNLPHAVHGRASGRDIVLRRSLLASQSPASDAPAPAAVALVHELAHLLDRSARGGFSRDARFLDLAGWRRSAIGGGREHRNRFTERSPDAYELENPREYVAVNLERFVFDPEYACRRPALYRHFAARLGERTALACAPGQVYVQADPRADSGRTPLLQVDPARVYEVDYLLAEPDAAMMSRWGHGMLRLVVCAPGRDRGPDCRLDLAHHRVLSFRAFVDDVQVSSWRGLTGAYPSRLFVLPLAQVVDEYTKVELRGLRSVPLRLERHEIDGLLERAAHVHWNYDGRYYFVGNNCAVETFRLLHDGVPRLAGPGLSSITPTGLLAKLTRAGIADARVLADAGSARRDGYYFESQAAHYQALLDIARGSLRLPVDDVHAWLELDPTRRTPWIEQADLRAAAALLVLEGAALRRQQQLAREVLKRRLLDPVDDVARGQGAEAAELMGLMDRLTRPARLLPGGGYGLPQESERDAIAREAGRLAERWSVDGARLESAARASLPAAQRAALSGAESNLARLGARLRELHRAAGGLDLAGPAGTVSTPGTAAAP